MIRLVTVFLLVLHTLDGREVNINPAEITTMRETQPDTKDDRYIVKGVRCVVSTTDGKYTSVVETCPTIKKMIAELDKLPP